MVLGRLLMPSCERSHRHGCRWSARPSEGTAQLVSVPGTSWCVTTRCTAPCSSRSCYDLSTLCVSSHAVSTQTIADSCWLLVQVHGMHRLEDVVKNLKEERDSRSLRSLSYGAESSVGKGVNKGKDGKAQAKSPKQQQKSDSKSKPQQQKQHQKQQRPQQLQQEQPVPDAHSAQNGDANGSAADVDSAVAQSAAEKLVL